MTIDWGVLSSMVGVMSAVVGVATIYLRLYVTNELQKQGALFSIEIAKQTAELNKNIATNFISKELNDARLNEIYTRIRMLEEWKNRQDAKGHHK